MGATTGPEPWLQGTLKDVPVVPRAVLHALELARQDLQHWCGKLTEKELNARLKGTEIREHRAQLPGCSAGTI